MKVLICAAEEERRHTQGCAAAHSQLGLTRDENAAFDNNRVTFDFPDLFVHSAMDVIPSTSRCNSAVNKQFSAVEIGELFAEEGCEINIWKRDEFRGLTKSLSLLQNCTIW